MIKVYIEILEKRCLLYRFGNGINFLASSNRFVHFGLIKLYISCFTFHSSVLLKIYFEFLLN